MSFVTEQWKKVYGKASCHEATEVSIQTNHLPQSNGSEYIEKPLVTEQLK